VPFCRRTSTHFKNEWLCGDHWRLVDRQLKRFRTKRLAVVWRLVERYEAETRAAQAAFAAGGRELPIWIWANRSADQRGRWRRLEAAIWRRMKRQAIERAMGISA
jgi:hypothetical protein